MPKILLPLSFVYSSLSKLDRALTKKHKLPKPVISIGNITWGGSGKTPIVIKLAQFLLERGLRPAILTRGFGRKSKEPLLIKNACNVNSLEAGDEPLLIAKSVPGAAVIVGKNRYAAAMHFQKDFPADVYILDDGFQHWAIKRDLDIICVNALNPFGNDCIIPAGILRQPISSLRNAGLIIITNSNLANSDSLNSLKEKITNVAGIEPIESYYGDYEIRTIDLKKSIDINSIKAKKIIALSGIGFSRGFSDTLKFAGFCIDEYFALKDHQRYNTKMLKDIFQKSPSGIIITTAKDGVKINEILDESLRHSVFVLTVKAILKDDEIWTKKVMENLR
jgi:tetraacyldisaccharide 4'-kinase